MSLKYRDSKGNETPVAGLNGTSGELVPSTALMKSGVANVSMPNTSSLDQLFTVQVTFDTPFEDANYVLNVDQCEVSEAEINRVFDKTASGFYIVVMYNRHLTTVPSYNVTARIPWQAFKLMTDTVHEADAAHIAQNTANFAPAFSEVTSYAVGDYVTYNNVLYRCTTAHTAGTWVAGHFTQVTVGGDLGAIVPSNASASNKLVTRAQSGAILPLVNLGTEYTAELKADISSGKFEKAVVGGYLTINGHVYYLAHPDYWLHTGDTECTTHHMLVIPAGNIGTGKMNSTNITTGGYTSSDMKTGNNSNTALAVARAQIIADFGAANILTHRELFTTAVTDGKASNWAWADSDVDLMNEVMVYGFNVWGSHPGYETGIDKCQLKLFQERPDLITTRSNWWLRGVVSAAYFAYVSDNGDANCTGASNALGVRPAFAIIG